MPRLKKTMLSIVPLCLKFRGRIVGAVSRSRLGIIASGLLIVSSVLLMIILFSMKYDYGMVKQPEQQPEERIQQQSEEHSVSVQNVNSVLEVLPEPRVEKDVVVISQSIKGPIQVDFGWQFHQVHNDWRYHTGIDIAGPRGQDVDAIEKGQVVEILRDPRSGLTVVVKSNTSIIYYGSLSEVRVSQDSPIRAGQTIGTMGSCDAEPYSHLHLAIKKDEQYIDPKLVISGNDAEGIK